MQVVVLPQKPSVEGVMPAGGWLGWLGVVGGVEGDVGGVVGTELDGGGWPVAGADDSPAVPQMPKFGWQPKPQC